MNIPNALQNPTSTVAIAAENKKAADKALESQLKATGAENPDGILEKDDFLKLLLVELQHQDPTSPMDTNKILSQTSQLATLEASKNTNTTLSDLSSSMSISQGFSTIGAIGKMADLGEDKLMLTPGETAEFSLFFPSAVKSGVIEIVNKDAQVVKSLKLEEGDKGVKAFAWDGKDEAGFVQEEGLFTVRASYKDDKDQENLVRSGTFPIEAVKFDNGKTLVKLGGNYVPFTSVKEIY